MVWENVYCKLKCKSCKIILSRFSFCAAGAHRSQTCGEKQRYSPQICGE